MLEMENRSAKDITAAQRKKGFGVWCRVVVCAGTYYELPIGRQEPCPIGFDYPILSAESKLHCKPVKL